VSNHFTSSVLTNYDIPAGSTGNQLQLVLVEVPQTISWPCTVTLRGNVDVPSGQHGITIASDRVTVDLGGASLSGLAGSLDGIAVPAAQRDLVVRNGTIRGMGNSGIWASNATSGHFQNLIVDQNGQHGLLAGAGTRVESCTVSNNTIGGMTTVGSSQVQSCIAHGNVDFGINAGPRSQVLDCQSSNNRLGIIANDGCEVSRCNVDDNQREGILANNGCWIGDCNARNNGFDAIRVSFSCSVLRNNTNGNGHAAGTQAAIFVGGNGNRIEGNNMSFEDHGIIVSGVNNIVVKNTLKSAALSIVAGNSTGPFVNVAGVGDFSGVVGANSPWANFFF
jgi:hypothetical protein